ARSGMGVRDADDFWTRAVNRAVNHKASLIDTEPGRIVDDVAVVIDLDQIRRAHFIPQQAERIEQKMMIRPRHACGDVGVNQIGHAEMRSAAIRRREIDADIPLFGADTLAHRWNSRKIHHRLLAEQCKNINKIKYLQKTHQTPRTLPPSFSVAQ